MNISLKNFGNTMSNIKCVTLKLENVCFYYNDKCILKNISLAVHEGEIVVLMGMSGSGKTTLMKIAGNVLSPQKGNIYVKNKEIGFMFQAPLLQPWLSVIENVEIPRIVHNDWSVNGQDLINRVGLADTENMYPWQLSGGMQRRVALARALISDPDFLILDEPFSGVDEITSERLYELLAEIVEKDNISCLLSTHNPYEAVYLADRIVLIGGSPTEIICINNIKLPRPRISKIRESTAFLEEVNRIRNILKTKNPNG